MLERAPQLNPVGAGIIMNPNAMAVLERNGLADEVRRDSWPYLTRETRDQRGRLLATRDYRPLYDSGKLAQGALVHRAHLLDVLYRSLPPGTVLFGYSTAEDSRRCRSGHRRRRHPFAGAARVFRRVRSPATWATARTA